MRKILPQNKVVKVKLFFLAWFAVKTHKFVEIMQGSYKKDSFSESSALMRAGRGMTIPVPENSWHFDICFHFTLNPKPNLENIFAKWSNIKMFMFGLENVRFSVQVSFLSKTTRAPWTSDLPCPKHHWYFCFNLSVKCFRFNQAKYHRRTCS